ncbi:MAG: hypothetical protein Q8L35_01580 [Actinomycetota bacterium]|nr:hypothetical protein [Actinomycetota bacterium]
MEQLRVSISLDRAMLGKVGGYYLYRSQEEQSGRPIIDGVYVQRETIGDVPPATMTLLLEWE